MPEIEGKTPTPDTSPKRKRASVFSPTWRPERPALGEARSNGSLIERRFQDMDQSRGGDSLPSSSMISQDSAKAPGRSSKRHIGESGTPIGGHPADRS